jgi:hypothetical protein
MNDLEEEHEQLWWIDGLDKVSVTHGDLDFVIAFCSSIQPWCMPREPSYFAFFSRFVRRGNEGVERDGSQGRTEDMSVLNYLLTRHKRNRPWETMFTSHVISECLSDSCLISHHDIGQFPNSLLV